VNQKLAQPLQYAPYEALTTVPAKEKTMRNQLQRFFQEEEGQSTVEYMLLISVVVIAIVAAAYVFLDPFKEGVEDLADDVKGGLSSGQIAGAGTAR
jgi:Flp pilus assembly pilin Flp